MDVGIDENAFLSIVEKHTGGTIAYAMKNGWRGNLLDLKFKEDDVNDKFVSQRFGFTYNLDNGNIYLSGLSTSDEEGFCLWQMYQKDHQDVTVVSVGPRFGGGFTIKVRKNSTSGK